MENYDFCGWATRNNVRCSDGRVIMKDAFKHCDGQIVPLVWNHQHDGPNNVLGHALLENRDEGVYTYCTFNNTEDGKLAKELVQHGDITQLSIYANKLKQHKTANATNVIHGVIREVSLVYAGANPEAYIESVIRHSDDGTPMVSEEEGVIYTGEDFTLYHSDEILDEKIEEVVEHNDDKEKETNTMADEAKNTGSENDKTIQEVYDAMTEEQKTVVHALVGYAVEEATKKDDESEEGDENMKHNVFSDNEETRDDVLTHADMTAIISDAKRYGSLKDAVLQHGIDNIEYLFPFDTDEKGGGKNVTTTPIFIQRDMGWVSHFMNAVHKTPFSRIKSLFANITEDDARALGYIKGKMKKDEVFTLLKRTTAPTTIYKKQKLDRDDVIDIVDFDTVAWIKGEMRMMLDEEIARACLVGDGRSGSSDDKINEQNIRPVWTDEDLYTIKAKISVTPANTDDEKAKAFIRTAIKARKDYKGSGNPTLYTTEDNLTNCLLIEDSTGREIYDSVEKLAKKLRVKEIVTVPVMENLTRTGDNGVTHTLKGIMLNPADYNVGADKGGAVNMFDDFDIDYNAMKYLIETRCSGALIKPYAAIALEEVVEGAAG